jgi:RNA polymerase sigma factor (sigma-70 family)
MTPSDDDLCKLWAAGDKRAGTMLVERNYESVDRFFRFKVGELHGPDLTQATFLAVQEGLTRKQAGSRFRPWLFGIARHKLLHHFRDGVVAKQRFDPDASSIADSGPSPSTLIAAGQRHRLLLAALQQLPVNVQVMLELHYWEEMKIDEIAEVVEKPPGTVRTHMRRGRLQLFEEMEKLAASPEDLETTRGGLEGWAERIRQDCQEDGDDE